MINVIINTVLQFLSRIPLKVWAIIVGGIILFSVMWYFISERNENIRRIAEEKAEKERLGRKAEGLQILVNTANIAIEIEREKQIANAQSANSKKANEKLANVRAKDSNSYSNQFTNAKQAFCLEFPGDGLCQ